MIKDHFLKWYQDMLGDDLPNEIDKYLEVKEFKRLKNIGYFCGADYAHKDMYGLKFYYSTYDHSISVAKIVWNFTHDLKQTIAALLHDISSPVFRHAIDFMNGDSHTQESTEAHTERIIRESSGLVECLQMDNINIEDVIDYKKYPIADNKRPKLSADRLEGLFSNNYIWTKSLSIFDIENIYNNVVIAINEDGLPEMSFTDINIAKTVFYQSLILNQLMLQNEDKLCLSMLGETTKLAINNGLFNEHDLYLLDEADVVKLFEDTDNEEIASMWHTFKNMSRIFRTSEKLSDNSFYINGSALKVKARYIDPLVVDNDKVARYMSLDDGALKDKCEADEYLDTTYAFVPIEKPKVLIKRSSI